MLVAQREQRLKGLLRLQKQAPDTPRGEGRSLGGNFGTGGALLVQGQRRTARRGQPNGQFPFRRDRRAGGQFGQAFVQRIVRKLERVHWHLGLAAPSGGAGRRLTPEEEAGDIRHPRTVEDWDHGVALNLLWGSGVRLLPMLRILAQGWQFVQTP